MHGPIGFVRAMGRGGSVSEEEVPGGARAAFANREVGGIAFDGENHIAGGKADRGIGMRSTVIEQLRQFFHCGFGGLRLFSGEFANSRQECGVNGTGIEKEGPENLEDAFLVGGIEGGCVVRRWCELGFGTVIRALPGVW